MLRHWMTFSMSYHSSALATILANEEEMRNVKKKKCSTQEQKQFLMKCIFEGTTPMLWFEAILRNIRKMCMSMGICVWVRAYNSVCHVSACLCVYSTSLLGKQKSKHSEPWNMMMTVKCDGSNERNMKISMRCAIKWGIISKIEKRRMRCTVRAQESERKLK